MNIAVIFAGGIGSRMNSKTKPKQFLSIHEKPIIIRTLELFDNHPQIDAIVIACVENWIDYLQDLVESYRLKKIRRIVPGGKIGQESIYKGLLAAKDVCGSEKSIVLIHDGVRPLIKEQTISDNIQSVMNFGSCITCVEVKETVLIVDKNEELMNIPQRSHCRMARAPQSFWLSDILEAHQRAVKENRWDFIDSCSMMQEYGYKLHLIKGPENNIKITTPDDFYTMRALLDAKENAQINGYEE